MTTVSDEILISAAKNFLDRTEFVHGQIVKQKKHFRYLTLGDTGMNYEGNMAFVEWLPPVIGSNDDPTHCNNLIIADCIVMADNGEGGVTPILMDSRFIEPAV